MEEKKNRLQKIKNLGRDQFEVLFQITQILNSSEYKDSLIEEALDYVLNVINAERGLFVKYDEQTDSFSVISARNVNQETITNIAIFIELN